MSVDKGQDHQRTNTTNTMVEPFSATAAWLWCFQPAHPQKPLQNEMTKVSVSGLYKYTDQLRKKLITKVNDFTLFLNNIYELIALKKQCIIPPTHFPPVAPHLASIPSTNFSLFCWLLYVPLLISGRLRLMCILFLMYFHCSNCSPK